MSRRQQYPRQEPRGRKPQPRLHCQKGWHCIQLVKNRCEYTHGRDDHKMAHKINKVFQYKDTIVVLDTYDPKLTPVCLLEPSLPITIVNRTQFNMDEKKYFLATLLPNQRPDQVALKLEKQLGCFGEWQAQLRILTDYFPRQYQLDKNESETRNGEIKINGELKKVITGHQGKKYYFQKVNKNCDYPLLSGCKVSYFTHGNTIKLTRINYPNEIRLSGIIQIDSNSQFYFVSRNQEYDDMNPYTIPHEITEKLREFKGLFPYSLLKTEPISQEKQAKINEILKEYLLFGRFKGWPHHSKYPIIELNEEVSIKNFKSLKDAIIYEAGIATTPFDKKQKEAAQKLVKKFKIKDYQTNRKIYDKEIYTVDNKTTKCHDDAVYIRQLQNGGFYVQIHIADVAALIAQGEELDSKLKKRDETIYIKNYHQPMLYESLKNLLSLKNQQEKLAFTLSFDVNDEGYIDYRTVTFERSIIVVQKNLAHQRLDSGVEEYPQLMRLNRLFDRSKIVDNNYILESETKSQIALSRLVFISSIIPTYLLQTNIQRAKLFKDSFEQYLKKMIESRKQDMEKWQGILDSIDKRRSQESKINKELKAIQKKIDNQVSKQREIIIKRLKAQQDELKNAKAKQKKEKKQKKQKKAKPDRSKNDEDESDEQSLQSKGQQKQLDELVLQIVEEEVKKKEQIQIEDEKQDEIKQQKEKKMRQKRTKALKEVNASDLESYSSQSEGQDSVSSGQQLEDEQFRYNAAVNGQKFLDKIFRNPFFNIDMRWESMDEINRAFRTILSKDKGKLYQQYFKRVQITNRQHFKYILKMERDKRRGKQGPEKEFREDRNAERRSQRQTIRQPRQRRQRRQRRNRNRDDQAEEQKPNQLSDQQNQLIKALKKLQRQQKHNKRKGQIKQPPTIIKQQHQTKNVQNEKVKVESNYDDKIQYAREAKENQLKKKQTQDKRKKCEDYQKMVQGLKQYMQADSASFIQKYQLQYLKDSKLSTLDISFNQKDKEIIGSIDQKSYKKNKILRLRAILLRNLKNQKNAARMQAISAKRTEKQQRKQARQKLAKQKQDKKRQAKQKQAKKIEIPQKCPAIDEQTKQKYKDSILERKQYYLNKYLQKFSLDQKLQFSSDQECQADTLQVRQAYKVIKARNILNLLKKQKPIKMNQQQKEETKDKPTMQAKKQKLEDSQKIIQSIKQYMEADSAYYIEKYEAEYLKDMKLSTLDISFNQKDKEIIGSRNQKAYKKHKITRLRVILRKSTKSELRAAEKQAIKKSKKYKKKQADKKQEPQKQSLLDKQTYFKYKNSILERKQQYLIKYRQKFLLNQKLQFSSDQQYQADTLQLRYVYKSIKSKSIYNILMNEGNTKTKKAEKQQQIENPSHSQQAGDDKTKQRSILQAQQKARTFQAKQQNNKMSKVIQTLSNWIKKDKKSYISRYRQQFLKDELRSVDVSISQKDRSIIGKLSPEWYKMWKKEKLITMLKASIPKKEIDKKLQDVNSIDPQIPQRVKEKLQKMNDYYVDKYKTQFQQQEKIQFSDDQEWEKDAPDAKTQLRKVKRSYLMGMLSRSLQQAKKVQKQEQAQQEKTQNGKEQKIIKKSQQEQLQGKKDDSTTKKNEKKEPKQQRLTKKQLKKKIEQQLIPFERQVAQKYNQEREKIKSALEQIKQSIKQQKQNLYNDLQKVNQQYNLLQLMTQQEQKKKESKKTKKQKKKDKKESKKDQKDQKSTILTQFIDNFKDYAGYAGFKFKQLKISEIDAYLQKTISMKELCKDGYEQIVRLNRQASKKGQNEEKLLKWNNPIRSYESLTVMRLIKEYKWLFEGEIYPSDIIRYHGDIKEIQKSLIDLEDYRRLKLEKGQLNKKVKEANREISKLEFYNILKRDENAVFMFLNIGSPCPERVKFVFHPILEEVEVDNLEFKQEIYKEVKGKVKIIRDFPLKLRVRLEK